MTAPPVTIGIPGEPVAQGRPRVAVVAGRARAYDPKTSRDWKATAQQHARDQMQRAGATVFVGPVRVAVSCVLSTPPYCPVTELLIGLSERGAGERPVCAKSSTDIDD